MPTKKPGRILVTGASTGIGRAIVENLSTAGYSVLGAARKDTDLETLRRLPNVTPIRLDVTREKDVARVADEIRASKRGLYGLVNNAGIGNAGALVEISVEELHESFSVNVDGMHRMVRAMFPFLRKTKGRIVNISSVNGFVPAPFFGPYVISKFAVEAYTDTLRQEVKEFGVKVSVVEPGGFRSSIFANAFGPREAELRKKWKNSLYRDQLLGYLNAMVGSHERLYVHERPLPTPVAEAVRHALFAPRPKPRYLVGSKKEVEITIDRLLTTLRQLNEKQAHSISKAELVAKLEKKLG
jgi:NAD(P)-dependent dehydrogenase (short-subunit alcohol dehydrogenase family)